MGIISKITIIIIAALLVWQFGVPLIDDTIKTPSDYLSKYLYPDSTNMRYQAYIKNTISNNKTVFPGTDDSDYVLTLDGATFLHDYNYSYVLGYAMTYQLGIEFQNAHGTLFGEYSWVCDVYMYERHGIYLESISLTPIAVKISSFSLFYKNNIDMPSTQFVINWEYSYYLDMYLVDNDGIPIKTVGNQIGNGISIWLQQGESP